MLLTLPKPPYGVNLKRLFRISCDEELPVLRHGGLKRGRSHRGFLQCLGHLIVRGISAESAISLASFAITALKRTARSAISALSRGSAAIIISCLQAFAGSPFTYPALISVKSRHLRQGCHHAKQRKRQSFRSGEQLKQGFGSPFGRGWILPGDHIAVDDDV